jgi:hypothetical protein
LRLRVDEHRIRIDISRRKPAKAPFDWSCASVGDLAGSDLAAHRVDGVGDKLFAGKGDEGFDDGKNHQEIGNGEQREFDRRCPVTRACEARKRPTPRAYADRPFPLLDPVPSWPIRHSFDYALD